VSKDQLMLSIRWIMELDVVICGLFNRMSRPPKVKTFFVSISELGDGGGWYALILALPIIYGPSGFMTSFDMIRIGIVNLVIYKIIKQLTVRPRPCAVSMNITVGTAPLDQYSFPSGHTMHAVAFSMIATSQHTELALVLIPFSTLVALSRVVLGLHYPTDVIVGAIIGGYVASILMRS
jgi:undecaprenyl-diphosphatase